MYVRQLQLLRLLEDGDYHRLDSLSQAAAWEVAEVLEALRQLHACGLDIKSRNNSEYALTEAIEWLDESTIRARLQPSAMAAIGRFELIDTVDSTNRWLADQPFPAMGEAAVCLAESQSHGRGRLGRVWLSPPVSNLYLSVSWVFDGGSAVVQGLSLAIGVAVAEACEALGIADIGLKWPNDLVCAGGKLGGILIELKNCTVARHNVGLGAIIGIGINVKHTPDLPDADNLPASDLCTLGSGPISRNILAAELLNRITQTLKSYAVSGLGPYLDRWQKRDVLRGCQVVAAEAGTKTAATALGIDHQGAYRLRTAEGVITTLMAGTLRLDNRP